MAPAPFSIDDAGKYAFLKVFKEIKFPYGCVSNIARCVQDREKRLVGYKSHDAYIMLYYLLQVAVKNSLPKSVAICLIRLGDFFGICVVMLSAFRSYIV